MIFSSISNDLQDLFEKDGFHKMRTKELIDLTKLVQKRLHFIQNPSNCTTGRKLICHHRNECGLGCDMHNFVNCFALAYALERELVIWPDQWIYHKKGYQDIFLPLSYCRSGEKIVWQADHASELFLHFSKFLEIITCIHNFRQQRR
jgi:hypothetical protein